ncbi:MAG: MFS transporter [Gammaproteobacteria bacterium]|nr:MFS transporter [Gammaproteobacteria bacterium]MBU2024070.1 MFS transporter [Gammaproteobacteria bacterium]MBU2240792.1 MFS transporter [Gammaproteobacteria bacterium]MBU2319124.1 MFS transporter [Gammaproteobacteria bacterium]MBU2413377.1 MFS transporter [Gammaproteobacteria bacterium]
MSHRFGFKGNLALMVSHCAGMLDLMALPLWVGILVASYQFDSQQAGGLVTLFLIGAVCASVLIAPRFKTLNRRKVTSVGFLASGLCFFAASQTNDYLHLAILHVVAGVSSSAALSMAHGMFARGENPHRLFAIAGLTLGVMGVVFMGATPNITQVAGGHSLFIIFGGIMTLAAFFCVVAFPSVVLDKEDNTGIKQAVVKIPSNVWYGIVGTSLMAVTQAMTFSFMERVGNDRGFAADSVTLVLVVMALINIVAAALAGIFQKRFSAQVVLFAGPVLQIILSNIMMNSSSFAFYAASAACFVAIMIFTHTFAFGLLARLDVSGRAMAATPAMLMIGAAIGPVLGGTIIKLFDYQGIGIAALVFGTISLVCFIRVFQRSSDVIQSESVA